MNIKQIKQLEEWFKVDFPPVISHSIFPGEGVLLYNFIREKKPKHIVETGCGISTLFILTALHDNKEGELLTIDISSERSDWIHPIISKVLNNAKWETAMGTDSIEYLKNNINNMSIDFFFHDSLHTPNHIWGEWSIIRKKTKWYAAHNYCNKQCHPFFISDEFEREWKKIYQYHVLGIWEKRN
jgi:predicted O-methyltransferase YrrM